MTQDAGSVPHEVIERVVAELEHLMDEARDKWSLPKSDDPARFTAWHNREMAYRQALQVLADAGLAPKYAAR